MSAEEGVRRRRKLSEEERRLWAKVAKSAQPLRPPKVAADPDDAEPAKPVASAGALKSKPARAPAQRPPASVPPIAPLGRREKLRISRGVIPIDARLDLHGMTQRQAHGALLRFLKTAQAREAKFVLVITGKGTADDWPRDRGVLRRQLPLWLKLPEFRALVASFEAAHAAHGGEGAFYVRVRRRRAP
jgi:DNA-nicking Smr family endonuclease